MQKGVPISHIEEAVHWHEEALKLLSKRETRERGARLIAEDLDHLFDEASCSLARYALDPRNECGERDYSRLNRYLKSELDTERQMLDGHVTH